MANTAHESILVKTNDLDLAAYFQRIGYTDEPLPNLATLRALQRLHPQAIPFENLNPLFRIPVALDLASLEQKLVGSGRGGYCFEHNTLLKAALEAIGFPVRGLAARVVWNMPEGTITPRGHMLLQVTVDGEDYIVDVGFGGLTLTSPLRLVIDVEQPTPHETFRLTADGDQYILQVQLKGEWQSVYRFTLEEQFPVDYQVTNWYLSNHPGSHFVNNLIAARPTPEGRIALRNNELTIHLLDGATEKRTLADADEISRTLEETFGITLPMVVDREKLLQRTFMLPTRN